MPRTAELAQDIEKRRRESEERRRLADVLRDAASRRQAAERAATERFNARPSGAHAPVASETARAGGVALGVERGEIPASWLRDGAQVESDDATASRARDTDRGRRRREAYDRSTVDGLVMDSDALDALQAGTVQGVTLGFGDELAGVGRAGLERQPRGFAPVERETYTSARDASRADNDRLREQSPEMYQGGELLGSALPALLVPGPTAESIAGRVGQATLTGGAFGGVDALGHARGPAGQQAGQTLEGMGYGAAGGAIGQSAGELVDAGGRAMRGEAQDRFLPGPSAPRQPLRQVRTPEQAERIRTDPELRGIEDQRVIAARDAARHRLMAISPGATRGDLDRALDGYPGGAEQLADDLRAFGIVDDADRFAGVVPEAADQAQQRARFLREDAGRAVGATDERMVSAGATVDMRNVSEDLRRQAQAQRAQLSPMGDRRAAELEALAARFESEGGGSIPFDAPETAPSARRVLAGQDEAARFGGSSPDAQRPYAAEQARQVRRSVRGEMDESIGRTLPPEEAAQHLTDRRRFSAAATATDLADQGAARASGNRQLSLTDTIAGSNGGVLDQVLGVIRNRFIRGREHAFMAQIGEAQADRLAREVSRRLAGQGNTRAAAALDVARRRGGPAAGVMIREWMESTPEGPQEVAAILAGGQAPSQPSTPVPVDEDAELLRSLMPAEQAPTELSDEEEQRLMDELL